MRSGWLVIRDWRRLIVVLCLKIRVITRTCPALRSSVSRQATYRPTFLRTSSSPSYGNLFPRWGLMLNFLLARYASNEMLSLNLFAWLFCKRDAGVKSGSCQPNQQSAIPNFVCLQPSEMQSAYDCEFEQLEICTKKVVIFRFIIMYYLVVYTAPLPVACPPFSDLHSRLTTAHFPSFICRATIHG